MSFLDGIFARDFFWNGVLQRLAPVDFLSGFTLAFNPATQRIEITAAGGGGGAARLGELVLSAGPCISSPVNGGVFIGIDDSGGGTYSYSGDALFEAGTGLAAHYTGSDDLSALARVTVTVQSEVHADFQAAIAIDNGDVLGAASSPHQQSQLIPTASSKLYTMTCERRVDLNNSTRSSVTASICVPAGTYDSGVTIVSAKLTLVF